MIYKPFTYIIATACVFLINGCTAANGNTLYIGPYDVLCLDPEPHRCLLFKENPEEDYASLSTAIEGFEFEEGYSYELLIREANVGNPPEDGNSVQFNLIKVVSKTVYQLPDELSNTSWQLKSINGEVPLKEAPITLSFEGSEGEVAGGAGCNRYYSTFVLEETRVFLIETLLTMQLCLEISLMEQESAYMDAFAAVRNLELTEGQLILWGDGVELVYLAKRIHP